MILASIVSLPWQGDYRSKVLFSMIYSLPLIKYWADMVGKISAFRSQGPQFDPRLYRHLNICATLFST